MSARSITHAKILERDIGEGQAEPLGSIDVGGGLDPEVAGRAVSSCSIDESIWHRRSASRKYRNHPMSQQTHRGITQLSIVDLHNGTLSSARARRECQQASHEFRAFVAESFGAGSGYRSFSGFLRAQSGVWYARHRSSVFDGGSWRRGVAGTQQAAIDALLPSLDELGEWLDGVRRNRDARSNARVAAYDGMLDALQMSLKHVLDDTPEATKILAAIEDGKRHHPSNCAPI